MARSETKKGTDHRTVLHSGRRIPGFAKRAVDENLLREEITKAIKNWRVNHYPVQSKRISMPGAKAVLNCTYPVSAMTR